MQSFKYFNVYDLLYNFFCIFCDMSVILFLNFYIYKYLILNKFIFHYSCNFRQDKNMFSRYRHHIDRDLKKIDPVKTCQ